MNDAPRYSTLRDYLRVVRAHRVLIVVSALVFGGIALAASVRETPTYTAEASVAFSDPVQDLELLGLPLGPRQPADQRRAAGADLVERNSIAEGVAEQLDRKDVRAIAASVDARPEAQTNAVVIETRWDEPRFAARMANAYAREVRKVATSEERARLRRIADALREEYDSERRRTRDPGLRSAFAERVTRVEALREFARPVEIVKTAGVADSPVSPKPVRNTLLGLLLGFSLGIVGAFGRDALDRRVTSPRDVQARLELPLLAQLSDDALGTSPASQNGRSLPGVDREAIRILRSGMGFLGGEEAIRSWLVTSPMPEEGKSTVAASLAAAAATAGQRALLVECDLRRPSLAERLEIKPKPGLAEILDGDAAVQDVVQTVAIPGAPGPLSCITAGARHERPAELLGSARMRSLLEELGRSFDVVVLDGTPLLSVVDARELVPQVEGVVLCVRPGRTTREQIEAARAALDQLPSRPAGLVITGLRREDAEAYGYYAYEA
jgi:capsular exopolysaccharide synthesis family protein